MKTEIWLKIAGKKNHHWWGIGTVSAFKTKPSIRGSEIALKVVLELPDAIFEIPQYEAKISVPDSIIPGSVVNAEVADNIAAVLSQQLGINVHVSAEDQQPRESAHKEAK